MIRFIKRLFNPRPLWFDAMDVVPVSNVFGLDRGTPIDRYYIENFLYNNQHHIKGKVLEIAESTYSKKFGKDVASFEVLHVDKNASNATIIGDLTAYSTLPENAVDCFICTQTLNFIYDVKSAVRGIHRLLKPGGTALLTVAGISQISRYDMDRWGDFWRFTDKSIAELFHEVFPVSNVDIQVHGNVFASVCFLQGISVEEINKEKLDVKDNNYQVTITIIATK